MMRRGSISHDSLLLLQYIRDKPLKKNPVHLARYHMQYRLRAAGKHREFGQGRTLWVDLQAHQKFEWQTPEIRIVVMPSLGRVLSCADLEKFRAYSFGKNEEAAASFMGAAESIA